MREDRGTWWEIYHSLVHILNCYFKEVERKKVNVGAIKEANLPIIWVLGKSTNKNGLRLSIGQCPTQLVTMLDCGFTGGPGSGKGSQCLSMVAKHG